MRPKFVNKNATKGGIYGLAISFGKFDGFLKESFKNEAIFGDPEMAIRKKYSGYPGRLGLLLPRGPAYINQN